MKIVGFQNKRLGCATPGKSVILYRGRLFTAVYLHSARKDFIYHSRCRRGPGIQATSLELARVFEFRCARMAASSPRLDPINNALLRILYTRIFREKVQDASPSALAYRFFTPISLFLSFSLFLTLSRGS